MRQPIIAGNWKMFKTVGASLQFVQALSTQLKGVLDSPAPEVVICPPFTALYSIQGAIEKLESPIVLAAQTMGPAEEGAYTGEISPEMLTDLSVGRVVLGHSERRQYYGETDASVAQKTQLALLHHLKPVVCVGETLEEREAGATDRVVCRQVLAVVEKLDEQQIEKLVIAYEPVWAIGTGKVCAAEEANRVCGLIRSQLGAAGQHVRVLYGGSVKPDNADELMRCSEIDGALVGGASLTPDSFYQIIKAACSSLVASEVAS
jgi:triosephosphate isomerase (TIM)